MSIFESLLNESDENVRRAGILDAVFVNSRKKVADIVWDNNVECKMKTDAKKWAISITYQNVLGKIILTPVGIDRLDSFGTAWEVSSPAKKEHSRGLYKA